MRIFISWSGEKSRQVAMALRRYLQDVNRRNIAWLSSTDISAGQQWALELANQLEVAGYGIVCVTRESLHSEWLIFEAGVLSKSVSGRVCPYLVDVRPGELTGPLSQFQAAEARRERTWWLLQSINLLGGDESLPETDLERYHKLFWPDLEAEIGRINREFRPFPEDARRDLLQILPRSFYRTAEIEMHAMEAGVSVWEVNWNQAAIHVWRQLLQVAITDKRIEELLEISLRDAPAVRKRLEDALTEVREWNRLPGGDSA